MEDERSRVNAGSPKDEELPASDVPKKTEEHGHEARSSSLPRRASLNSVMSKSTLDGTAFWCH